METLECSEGISVLLTYSMVADRAWLALSHFLDPERPLTQADKGAIERAERFLEFAKEAQVIATERKMRGFTTEGIQVRQATYDVYKTLSKEQKFEFLEFLDEVKCVVENVRTDAMVTPEAVDTAKTFFAVIRDLFLARSARPMEVVRLEVVL